MALDRSRGFWAIIGYAVVFGVVLAVAALAFLGLVKGGAKLWFTLPKNPDWFSGSLWWVAVTAAAGVLVGVLRRVFRLPAKLPGTLKELRDERVEPSTVLKAVAVSLVSLVGGASLGPEDALGKMGGGLGTWVSERRKLDESATATNTLSGISGAFGGLLSSPILATSFVVEIARPKRPGFGRALVAALLSSTVAFAVYFPIAGTTFLGIYTLPPFKYEDWQLAAAVPLGLAAGALALITVAAIGLLAKLTAPLAKRTILRPALGGIAFGLVGVALPLTMFTGTSQLTTVIHDGAALGAGLIIAVVFTKILTFALCEATGFIGGPILVMLFIGGTAGIAAHLLIPGLPEGLTFATMFAALLGSLVAAPFTMIVLVALHDPHRGAAARACGHRGPHVIPRRLGLWRAHGPGAKGTQTRPAGPASSRTAPTERLVTLAGSMNLHRTSRQPGKRNGRPWTQKRRRSRRATTCTSFRSHTGQSAVHRIHSVVDLATPLVGESTETARHAAQAWLAKKQADR